MLFIYPTGWVTIWKLFRINVVNILGVLYMNSLLSCFCSVEGSGKGLRSHCLLRSTLQLTASLAVISHRFHVYDEHPPLQLKCWALGTLQPAASVFPQTVVVDSSCGGWRPGAMEILDSCLLACSLVCRGQSSAREQAQQCEVSSGQQLFQPMAHSSKIPSRSEIKHFQGAGAIKV